MHDYRYRYEYGLEDYSNIIKDIIENLLSKSHGKVVLSKSNVLLARSRRKGRAKRAMDSGKKEMARNKESAVEVHDAIAWLVKHVQEAVDIPPSGKAVRKKAPRKKKPIEPTFT